MKHIFSIIAIMGTALPVSAQQSYTLEECRAMALEHNIAIRNADRATEQSEEQKKEAFTNYFPTVSAAGITGKLNKDFLGMIDGGTYATVTAIQPVFAGGQIINGNKLARVGLDASRIQQEQQANEVRLTVEKYYWQILVLQEKLTTLDRVYAMLERLNTDVTASVKAGVALRNDLLQVQLKQNEVESNRIKLRNGIKVSKMVLAQYAGIDDADYSLGSDINVETMPAFPLELKQDHNSSLLSTTEYRLLSKNVESTTIQRKMEVGKNLPKIGVGASYSYMNLMSQDSWTGAIFATVSVPISSWWGGSHAIKRKKLAEQTAREQLEDNSEQLIIRMEKDWNDVEDAYKQLALAKKSIEQSEENLRLNNDFYRAGTTTMSEVLDAQQYYQQARDSYVEAYSDYRTKIEEYKVATGK